MISRHWRGVTRTADADRYISHLEEDTFPHVHQVTSGDLPGVGAAFDKDTSHTRSARVDSNMRLVPARKSMLGDGEENRVASGKRLRQAMAHFPLLPVYRRQRHGRTTSGRYL